MASYGVSQVSSNSDEKAVADNFRSALSSLQAAGTLCNAKIFN